MSFGGVIRHKGTFLGGARDHNREIVVVQRTEKNWEEDNTQKENLTDRGQVGEKPDLRGN